MMQTDGYTPQPENQKREEACLRKGMGRVDRQVKKTMEGSEKGRETWGSLVILRKREVSGVTCI